ncbi:MAG: molybdenum cofactor guanylyltransferase [Chlorobi bacterium]|nr:molybdenum cofactor guanylyltransferase [Chlorobiota bacterium]
MELTGIILAGGKSSRVGSDKGLLCYDGKQLVSYALELIAPFCDNILISANNSEYEKFGFPVIYDEIKDVGPAGGILTALKSSENDFNIIVSCDMPFLKKEAVELLINNVTSASNYIPVHKNGIEPLFGIYQKEFLNALESGLKKRTYKLKTLLEGYDTRFVNFDLLLQRYPLMFRNFNYLSDFNN